VKLEKMTRRKALKIIKDFLTELKAYAEKNHYQVIWFSYGGNFLKIVSINPNKYLVESENEIIDFKLGYNSEEDSYGMFGCDFRQFDTKKEIIEELSRFYLINSKYGKEKPIWL
jgi:hypothetical protein